ncbi:MAG: hypothetical protein M1480_08915 [Bacteroidetes bacterium]|nr:hypothetical protein [Bacteroidota bacterium]
MKSIFNKIKVIIFISSLLIANSYAQETHKVKGSIGNEKMGKDKIVICVLGTKVCMPVNIDTNMTVKYQDKDTKLTDLPFGLYLEANIIGDKPNGKTVKSVSIDETKTVICFTELKEEQEKKLSDVLRKTKGVNYFEIHPESGQVYIAYNPKTIAYKDLENRIKEAGFDLE